MAANEDLEAFEKGRFGTKMGFGTNPAVLVVDMTKEFVDPRYPLASRESCKKTSLAIGKLLASVRRKHVPIIYTKNMDSDIHPSANRLRKQRVMPSKKLPGANEIVGVLTPAEKDIVIQKAKASPFFETVLQTILASLLIDTLIISGATASGCVRAAVVDAASYGYYVTVPKECCGDRSEISHKVGLMDLHLKYADAVSLDDAVQYLSRLRR